MAGVSLGDSRFSNRPHRPDLGLHPTRISRRAELRGTQGVVLEVIRPAGSHVEAHSSDADTVEFGGLLADQAMDVGRDGVQIGLLHRWGSCRGHGPSLARPRKSRRPPIGDRKTTATSYSW